MHTECKLLLLFPALSCLLSFYICIYLLFLLAFNQDLGANVVPPNMKACVGMIVNNP